MSGLPERRAAEPERDARLERIERKLDRLAETVAAIAVQNQRLNTLEKETALLFGKIDAQESRLSSKIDAEASRISKTENFQASCPRHGYRAQIYTIWVFISAIILAVIAAFIKGA